MTADTARAALARLAMAIRRVHELPAERAPDLGTFSPFETVRAYLAIAADRGVLLPDGIDRALGILGALEARLWPPPVPALCHNDLLPANFVDQGDRVRILDWEYAAMGDPYFDLGNLAANLELSEAACEELAAAYFGAPPASAALARLRLMRLVSDMREAAWGLVQAGLSTLEFDFATYARNHLARFAAYAAPGAVERDLEQADRAMVHP